MSSRTFVGKQVSDFLGASSGATITFNNYTPTITYPIAGGTGINIQAPVGSIYNFGSGEQISTTTSIPAVTPISGYIKIKSGVVI